MKKATRESGLMMATLLAASVAAAAPPAPSSGWLADGDTTDRFASVDGTAAGSLAYAAGVFGQAFSFDGNGSVDLPQSAFSTFAASDTTIVAWLKTAANGDTAAVKFEGQWMLYFDAAEPGVITGLWGGGYGGRLSSGVNVGDGQWHHVASVYAGGNASIYVDGSLRASGARGRAVGGTTSFGAGYFRNYVGLLDDVGIYRQALTEQQIQAVMQEGLAAAVPEPATYSLLLAGLLAVGAVTTRRGRIGEGART